MPKTLLLCFSILLCASCADDPAAPVVDGTGAFTGRWDGGLWLGRGYAVLVNDTLHVVGHRPDPRYYYDEYVSVRTPFDGPGDYEIRAEQGELAKITGGDAGWFPQATGRLVVHNSGETVSGSLNLTANGPDGTTWEFRNGEFDVPVYASFAEVPSLSQR